MDAMPEGEQGYPVTTPDGFAALFDAALSAVFGSAMRFTGGNRTRSEDLTQDAFNALLSAVRSGRVTHADVGWLITVVRRRAIDDARRSVVEQRVLAVVGNDRTVPSDREPDWRTIEGASVLSLCAGLPDDQRIALLLRHVDGLDVPAIAREMDRSINSVESLLSRARRTLRSAAKELP